MKYDSEAYRRLKEEEKVHLAALKRLKEQYRLLARKKRLFQTLEAALSPPEALEELEQALQQIREETARLEARLDIALESTPPDNVPSPTTTEPPASDTTDSALPEKTIGRIRSPRKPEPPHEREED